MSRMQYVVVAMLMIVTAGVSSYTTREIVRGHFRVEVLTGSLNDALARADALNRRVQQLEAAPSPAPTTYTASRNPAETRTTSEAASPRPPRIFPGQDALEARMRIIANNIANANTIGFKRIVPVINASDANARAPGTRHDMRVGPMIPTDRSLDLMIEGEGFFRVTTVYEGKATIAYTRAGNFARNEHDQLTLANSEGSVLDPSLVIPLDATSDSITIGRDGQVLFRSQGSARLTQVGQIMLARFVNPEGLLSIGANLFIETDACGAPVEANPLQDSLGGLLHGVLEGSNVKLEEERLDMALARQAFDINSQYLQGLAYRDGAESPH